MQRLFVIYKFCILVSEGKATTVEPTVATTFPQPGGVLLGMFGRGVPPTSLNPDPISDQKNAVFHTRFQTWPQKSIPIFRPDLVHD